MMDELLLADPTLPRFVYWKGDLYALPSGLSDIVGFNLLTCKPVILYVMKNYH
jgi:hypothetical protein